LLDLIKFKPKTHTDKKYYGE